MKVLVLGAAGQLGTELVGTAGHREVVPHKRSDVDIIDGQDLVGMAQSVHPAWIINCVAYNKTEEAERDRETAFEVNGHGAANAARAARSVGARLVHLSTDFVFDGQKKTPYVESDEARPLSAYGESKRAGEKGVLAEDPDNLVVRTATLFGRAGSRAKGGNIVDKVVAKAKAGEPLRFVNDIRMSPTYARDLAKKIWELIDRAAPGGLYHLTNAGQCTWQEFAQEIVNQSGLTVRVEGVPAPSGGMRRAPNSALRSERLAPIGVAPMRAWREALADYLRGA